jgi:hypothetical protein
MKKIFQKIKKSHFRIQSAVLNALQKVTKATIITNFANEHLQYLQLSIIDFNNDEFMRDSCQKNDDSSEEFEIDKELEKDARLLRSIYYNYK